VVSRTRLSVKLHVHWLPFPILLRAVTVPDKFFFLWNTVSCRSCLRISRRLSQFFEIMFTSKQVRWPFELNFRAIRSLGAISEHANILLIEFRSNYNGTKYIYELNFRAMKSLRAISEHANILLIVFRSNYSGTKYIYKHDVYVPLR
jgi:hypothetical protein